MTIKEVRKHLNLDNDKISKLFNYASKESYQKSSKRPVIDAAIIKIYELTKAI
jgi:cyanate lyase